MSSTTARDRLDLAADLIAAQRQRNGRELGEGIAGLYLLHLEPRYRHAGHYLGWSTDVGRRLAEHLAGGASSSPLIRAQLAAGGRVELVRVWVDADRTAERRMKNQHNLARFCPTCRAAGRPLR